jgi:flagellar operon protein
MTTPERITHVTPLTNSQPAPRVDDAQAARTVHGQSFEDVLRSKVAANVTPRPVEPSPVEPNTYTSTTRFSAHAMARLAQRGIDLSQQQLQRLDTALDKAAGKGARDALVLLDDNAMVVSVENRTVITALGMHQARDNVFTNIDAAVIA